MAINSRIQKLIPKLSAKERAILVLRAWRDGTPEDRTWRSTMSQDQIQEFNRLIELMNGSMLNMSNYITIIDLLVGKLELRLNWLISLMLWDEQADEVGRAVRIGLREPITQSQFDAKQKEMNEEWTPVADLAAVLAGDKQWAPEDLEPDGDVTDAGWERACAEAERTLRSVVAKGRLAGKGRGVSLKIQAGSFNEWANRTTTPVPENALSYDVHPDSRQDWVERETGGRFLLYRALGWDVENEVEPPLRQRMMEGLRSSLAAGYEDCLGAVEAVELVNAETTVVFGGCTPIRLEKEELLAQLRTKLELLARELEFLQVGIPEPTLDEELVEKLRHMVHLDD